MSDSSSQLYPRQTRAYLLFWFLIALYAAARVLQVFPGRTPMLTIVALHVLPPLLFAVIHGAMLYGYRGILVFFALCLIVGNVIENVGVRTGFPFGQYYFTDVMGPKIFFVPVFLGLAYLGMGYLSWTLARAILGAAQGPVVGPRVVALPLVAAFVMVAWDLSLDPVWATVVHAWIWPHGGIYFGVPLSNFYGWSLNVYLLYQLFALYLRRQVTRHNSLPRAYYRWPVLLYAVSAAGNLLLLVPQPGPSVVSDPTGKQWQVSGITSACALVSMFVMGPLALLAWVRLTGTGAETSPSELAGFAS